MITSKNGVVTIDGRELDLLAETMCILGSIYEMLKKNHGEEYAKTKVESLGRYFILREEGKLGKRYEHIMN